MAVLGLSAAGGVIICNGYKDREYIRLALIARRLGLRIYLVVEKLSELKEIVNQSRELAVSPLLGVRVRLASIGAGNWQNTGGDKSKFGLHAAQVLYMLEQLREHALLDQLQLLHFHLGSQLANLKDIEKGVQEAARTGRRRESDGCGRRSGSRLRGHGLAQFLLHELHARTVCRGRCWRHRSCL